MTEPRPSAPRQDPAQVLRLHFMLRFSIATTASFVICELMGWQPSPLGAVLAAVLMAKLPGAPPFKVGVGLVLIMAVCAWLAFLLTVYLTHAPHILFLIIGVLMFVSFSGLAQAKAQLPFTLLLICLALVPLVTLTIPVLGQPIVEALVRGMALAVISIWCVYAIWPRPLPPAPAPPPPEISSPLVTAALATATVLPLVLVYLLFGLTDAIPVLLTTVLIVANMDEERGRTSGLAKLLGNFVGGLGAIAAYFLLQIAPNLVTLALVTFMVSLLFANQIAKGGVGGGNALLAYNSTIIILALAMLKGDDNSGTIGARLVQFAIACCFAVGMMTLLWRGSKAARATPA